MSFSQVFSLRPNAVWWIVVIAALLGQPVRAAETHLYHFALIAPDSASPFWQAAHAGAIKAQREFTKENVEIRLLWLAPRDPNSLPQEVNLLGDAVGSGVDGIAVAPLDPHAMVPSVELAIRQKIPVITMEWPLDYPLLTSVVATNNYHCGAEASIIMGKLLEEKGKVLIVRHLAGDPSTTRREIGFLDGVRKYYSSLEVVAPDEYAGPTRDDAYRLTQRLLKQYGPQLSGLYTADPTTTQGAISALKDSGLADRIKHVGFLLGPEALTAIQSGILQGVVAPSPFDLGYLTVKALYESKRGRTVSPRIDVQDATVTADSVNDPANIAFLTPPISEFLTPAPGAQAPVPTMAPSPAP